MEVIKDALGTTFFTICVFALGYVLGGLLQLKPFLWLKDAKWLPWNK